MKNVFAKILFLVVFIFIIHTSLLGQLGKSVMQQIHEADLIKLQLSTAERKIDSYFLSHLNVMNAEIATGLSAAQIRQRFNSRMFPVDSIKRIYLEITALSNKSSAKAVVINAGGTISTEGMTSFYAWIPIDKIKEIASDVNINHIDLIGLSVANSGSIPSEGDVQLFADSARNIFYTDGSSVNVGVISNGINYYQNSINSGDLGPFGTVDNGTQYVFGSEGVAMMEIVHDLAPGSYLYFGGIGVRQLPDGSFSAPDGPLDMANRINALAANCKIIVDDVSWLCNYPYYEDWDISNAISNFVNTNHGTYISSAGNAGQQMYGGVPSVRSYPDPY